MHLPEPMLTPLDDYPVHQTSRPLAMPASGDPNHYDRFFFNGSDAGRIAVLRRRRSACTRTAT